MTYVMSDLHGNLRRFEAVMEQIRLQPTDELYILGDLSDRYPDGIALIQRLRRMENVHVLFGNHEWLLLRALDEPFDPEIPEQLEEHQKRLLHWYRNGGSATHSAFLALPETEQKELLEYLRNLPLNADLMVNGQHYKLTHAVPEELYERFHREEKYRDRDVRYVTVWRRLEPEEPLPSDYITVFGHTPTEEFQDCDPLQVWYGQNRINIDCGCCFPEQPDEESPRRGRLACLRLEDGAVFYSESPRE